MSELVNNGPWPIDELPEDGSNHKDGREWLLIDQETGQSSVGRWEFRKVMGVMMTGWFNSAGITPTHYAPMPAVQPRAKRPE